MSSEGNNLGGSNVPKLNSDRVLRSQGRPPPKNNEKMETKNEEFGSQSKTDEDTFDNEKNKEKEESYKVKFNH